MQVAYVLGGLDGTGVVAIGLSLVPTPPNGYLPLVLVPVCCVLAYLLRMVKLSGALAGTAVSLAVGYGTGWPGLAMLAALLGLGHATTMRKRRKRDSWQVLCNGSVAGLAAMFVVPAPAGLVAMGGALATSLSDTAGGELGQRFGGMPRYLLLGRKIPRGTDGGMSLVGTAAGLLMAAVVPIAGWAAGGPLDTRLVLVVTAGGFAGHFADSFLGAVVQPHLGNRGNDWTNFLATLVGAVATLLIFQGLAMTPEVLAAPK